MGNLHYKDTILNELAEHHNVAQFVSFGSDGVQRYSRVLGFNANHRFESLQEAIDALLASSSDRSVNVRSFVAAQPRSNEFIQNLCSVDDIVAHIRRLQSQGLTTIVNETIDVRDGGVSGVATPFTLEFAPDSTPRVVEEEGVARLPRDVGDRLLRSVYGFAPDTPTRSDLRLEFSIHPKRRGWMHKYTILWEKETLSEPIVPARPTWPNRFSSFLGDKVYGLLIGHLVGLPVPFTTVVGRRFAPFTFGEETGEHEIWLRTAPSDRTPGKFTTNLGWIDPFILLNQEDALGNKISSILAQCAVKAVCSGAAITEADGNLRIEGVSGTGDDFMLTGIKTAIPKVAEVAVKELNVQAAAVLGPVSFEWVFDGKRAWLVQLHVGKSASQGDIIYPGEPDEWIEFSAMNGLEELRTLVATLDPKRTGVRLIGSIGTSSHKGDLLRKAKVPSRLAYRAT